MGTIKKLKQTYEHRLKEEMKSYTTAFVIAMMSIAYVMPAKILAPKKATLTTDYSTDCLNNMEKLAGHWVEYNTYYNSKDYASLVGTTIPNVFPEVQSLAQSCGIVVPNSQLTLSEGTDTGLYSDECLSKIDEIHNLGMTYDQMFGWKDYDSIVKFLTLGLLANLEDAMNLCTASVKTAVKEDLETDYSTECLSNMEKLAGHFVEYNTNYDSQDYGAIAQTTIPTLFKEVQDSANTCGVAMPDHSQLTLSESTDTGVYSDECLSKIDEIHNLGVTYDQMFGVQNYDAIVQYIFLGLMA